MVHDFFAALGITHPMALSHQIIFFVAMGTAAVAGFMAKQSRARWPIMALVLLLLSAIAITESAPRRDTADHPVTERTGAPITQLPRVAVPYVALPYKPVEYDYAYIGPAKNDAPWLQLIALAVCAFAVIFVVRDVIKDRRS